MAGAGSRFAVAGYLDPKPLIPVHGLPMIQLVIDNLRPCTEHRFIFICQQRHLKEYELAQKFQDWTSNPVIIPIEGITQGAACTVLKARDYINNSDSLMIANSDQYIDFNIDAYLAEQDCHEWDGMIMTMLANDPKWSYAKLDEQKMVIEVVEKQVVSDFATVGIYNFLHGSDFVCSAEQMIEQDLRVNGEFYVAPTYNQLIAQGKKIGIKNIGSVGSGMYGLGTPADLIEFINHPISQNLQSRNL